ncbi:MAG TPA: MFS transporter [Dehalococcoidia bacterium]|nr:MFS transporter [Dehalococcoidia bacterium]
MSVTRVTSHWLFSRYPLPLGGAVFLLQVALGLILFATFQDYVPRKLEVGAAWPGYLLAAYGAGRFLFEAPTGAISDRVERKVGLLIGFVLMIPAIVLMAGVNSRYVFLFCAALLGLGTSFIWPATYAIAADLYPAARRGKVIGFLNVGQLAGFGIGALGGAQIVNHVTWEQFVLALVAISLATAATAIGVPSYRGQGWLKSVPRETEARLKDVLSLRLVLLSGIILASSTSLAIILPAIRPYGTEQLGIEFSELTVALIPAIIASLVLYVPAGHLADRLGRAFPYLLGLGLLAGGLLWLAETTAVSVAMIGAAVVFSGNVFIVPASTAAVMDLAPETYRGTLIGLNVALTGLGLTIGPAIGGPVAEYAGPDMALRVAAFVALGTAAALFAYSRVFRMHPIV